MVYLGPSIPPPFGPVTKIGNWRCFLDTLFRCILLSATTLLGASAASADTKTIGIVVRSWEMGRFTDLLVPVIKQAAAESGYIIEFRNSLDSVAQQAADVAELAAQGVDGIVVGLVNSDAGPEVGAAAAQNETPLVFMNVSPINTASLPEKQAYVGPDEYDVGREQALAVCAALGTGGRVGLLIGDLLHPAAATRTKAVKNTLRSDACDGVSLAYEETAQWNRKFATEVTGEWVAYGQSLDAVIANNDEMALGALDAFVMQGIDPASVFVTGVDGNPDGIKAVLDGKLDLTFLQDVELQGEEIFATLMRLSAGESQEKEVLLPLTPITAERCDASCHLLMQRPKL